MPSDRVIIVHLRRPRSNPEEARDDPFWEFGSFALTKCHGKNLMHPKDENIDKLNGARLAFAQGGKKGMRLVYLTPPVKIKGHQDCIEARWSPIEMPFRYEDAPILVSNSKQLTSHFPQMESSLRGGGRSAPEGQFSSNYRSCAKPLEPFLAEELIRVYKRLRKASPSAIAGSYIDALPWRPPKVFDKKGRKRRYKKELSRALGLKARRNGCKRRSQ